MLTATYTTPASEWTRACDAALAEWSKHIRGTAHLSIKVEFDKAMPSLGQAGPASWVSVGKDAEGRVVQVPVAIARLMGRTPAGDDIILRINPDWPWFFGQPSKTPGDKLSAISMLMHELAHGLFARSGSFGSKTPFDLHAQGVSGQHAIDPKSLLYHQSNWGKGAEITAADVRIAGLSGVPTHGDDILYLFDGAVVDGGGGRDVAIWLGTFSAFNARLANIERLELRGIAALNSSEQDIYRLYRAAFGRVPDLAGFRFWREHPSDLRAKAAAFCGSAEYARAFAGEDHATYIDRLYRNILGRAPEPAGYAYWLTRTDLSRAELLLHFALAEENKIGVPSFTV